MSSVECLRQFVNERLTAAAEEIFGVFQKTIVEYEEEIYRQRKLLDIVCKPEIKLNRIELLLQHDEEEEVLAEQLFCNQERSSSLDQEDPDSTDEEQDHVEPETDSDHQLLLNNFYAAESLTDQQLCNQERSSSLDQEDPEPLQIKEEQEELCTSQEGEEVVMKVEADTFVVTPTDEERDHVEPEPESDHQLLFHNFYVAESQEQKGYKHGNSTRDSQPDQYNQQYASRSQSNIVYNPNLSGVDSTALKQSFKCESCGKDFKHKSKLLRHVRIHTGDKPYLCNTCGKDFRFSSGLKVHMRTHTGERPYLCKTCGKRFSDMPGLTKHMRIHTGEKPCLCNTCGKRFSDMPALKKHIRVHTGEKPYPCKICGKNFRFSSVLKVHMRTHTGEKPYLCNTCGKKFGDMPALKRHARIHTGEKPYSCKTCGKDFRFGSYLTVHIRRAHTGERPYACKICGQRYFDASHLAKHKKTHTVQ